MLKILNFLAIALMFTACCDASAKKEIASAGVVQPIVLDQPARPAGQEDVIALTAPKMDTVRVGFIGLGMRGPGAVKRFTYLEGVKIVALCDIHPERVEAAQQILKKAGLPEAVGYSGTGEALEKIV